jgi:Raf kinase inhibitor-like YbhB/YbcL family protein
MNCTIKTIIVFTIVFCNLSLEAQTSDEKEGDLKMEIKITSPAFENGEFIPKKYTCDDVNISPPLELKEVPDGVKSIALICDDPDAPMGTWVHWVIYNIPSSVNKLLENIPNDKVLENGSLQGTNDFRKIGYGGPCPPSGTHRYFFKIYALDAELDLGVGATKEILLKSMKDHILARGKLVGKYSR